MDLFSEKHGTCAVITPRDYQLAGRDETFRLWNSGESGVLIRSFTGSGKTIQSCLTMDTWLRRGDNHRCMVVSYETQLVDQFAEEIEDVLGITPKIEMNQAAVDPGDIPKITVACRASLLREKSPTQEQLAELIVRGINDIGPSPKRACKSYLSHLRKGGDPDLVREEIERLKRAPEANGSAWSRLYKFDWRLIWLLIFDEAHRHAYHLPSVGHIVDWFDQNPESRRMGLTATPRRSDAVSIGHKMFPGIALDYPLFAPHKPCGVKDGWAVPYIQKYIEVEGVDFRSLAKMGDDFDEAELEMLLGTEKILATLVLPLLEMVGNRRTLIFSPGIEMAKNVARFINARTKVTCECGEQRWYPPGLIGDGVKCKCGQLITLDDVTNSDEQARELDGNFSPAERKHIYKDFKNGKFQFLSVCNLCREGYNNREVACVAIFRPVSKKASSLAEQMKGRACRPLKGVVDGLATKEERLAAIAASAKPNALIVDLVGITGLADCASTAQIYAEGLVDQLKSEGHNEEEAARISEEIAERAAEILAEGGILDAIPVEDAIAQAKREDDEAREKVRLEREAAEQHAREQAQRRAKAGAEVTYTEHDVGYGSQNTDPDAASESQYRYAARLGMEIKSTRSKRQLGRIIGMLLTRTDRAEVARLNRLDETQWTATSPSLAQLNLLERMRIPTDRVVSPIDASLLLDAKLNPEKFVADRLTALAKASDSEKLTAIAMDIGLVKGVLPVAMYLNLVKEGKTRRATFGHSNEPIPE